MMRPVKPSTSSSAGVERSTSPCSATAASTWKARTAGICASGASAAWISSTVCPSPTGASLAGGDDLGLGLDRVAVVAAADQAAEALDEHRRVEALGAVGVDRVDRARERVQAGEQDVDDLAGQARAALAQQLEDVLHLVREGRHALEAHGRGHALQGMGDAEDRVDGLAIVGRLLEAHDGEVELLEVLPALGQEHRKVLGGVHQSFR